MWEIENYNAELAVLSDMLARIQNKEFDHAFEEDLPLKKDIWQISAEREGMFSRFTHLNALMQWWAEQTAFVFAHATGPQHSGFRAPSSGDGPPQPTATARQWVSARTLLNRLYHQPLERALKIWTDDLVRRGMLSEEDAAKVQFDPPRDERRAAQLAEDAARVKEFDADFERVLERVCEVARKKGRHEGLPHRLALSLWNSRFAGSRKDRHTLNAYVKALEKERLLPPFSATAKAAGDAVKSLLGA